MCPLPVRRMPISSCRAIRRRSNRNSHSLAARPGFSRRQRDLASDKIDCQNAATEKVQAEQTIDRRRRRQSVAEHREIGSLKIQTLLRIEGITHNTIAVLSGIVLPV